MPGDYGLKIPEPRETHHERFITIKIRPRTIERVFFACVILVLAGMLFYNRSCPAEPTAMATLEQTTLAAQDPVQESAPEAQNPEVTETTALAAEPTMPEEGNETEKQAIQAEQKTSITDEGPIDPGLVEFKIEDVTVVKKSDTWAKATAIKIRITNKGNRIRPLIKIYAWDDNTVQILGNHQEGEDWKYDPGIGKEEEREFTIDTSISFSDLDLEKTIKAMLYESTTNKLVKDSTKEIDIQ